MRVNLGCGDRYADGWVNVDLGTTPQRVDQAVDLRGDLPWKPLSITHTYAGHVLEHLTPSECTDLLTRLLPCMVYLGELMVVGPDVEAGQAMTDAGEDMCGTSVEQLRHGAGRWAGDVHQWECTSAWMRVLLEEMGWVDVRELHINDVSNFWPVADRRPQWQRAVTGRRRGHP